VGSLPHRCRCPDRAFRPPLDPVASVGSGALKGAAATSASNAWAVGSTGTGKALIERVERQNLCTPTL